MLHEFSSNLLAFIHFIMADVCIPATDTKTTDIPETDTSMSDVDDCFSATNCKESGDWDTDCDTWGIDFNNLDTDSNNWGTSQSVKSLIEQEWDYIDDCNKSLVKFPRSIDKLINQRIELEFLELSSDPSFLCSFDSSDPLKISIILSKRFEFFNLSTTQQKILGIIYPFLSFKITFPRDEYWKDFPVVQFVYQAPEINGYPDIDHACPFVLSWPLKDRIRKTWSKDFVKSYKATPYTATDVETVMETCCCSFATAVHALKESKYSRFDAIVAIQEKGIPTPTIQPTTNVYMILMNCISSYVKKSHQLCIVCDEDIKSYGSRPSVCGKGLCSYTYDTLGLGFSLAAELIRDERTIDLFISLFISALEHKKLDFLEVDLSEIKLSYDEMYKILKENCPAVHELKHLALNGVDMKQVLDQLHEHLYSILRWLILTNRAYIKSLDADEQFSFSETPYQFTLVTDSPEREEAFSNLKKEEGKFFHAFHGSPACNWFSILRTGLKNLSNTRHMTTGASYGEGIYLAESSSTSEGYSKTSIGWENSIFGKQLRCMALCEVVGERVDKSGSGIYVIPDEKRVSTRYLFVFPEKQSIQSVCANKINEI